MHVRFVFNMLWSFRNRENTCLSCSVKEGREGGGGARADRAWSVLVGRMSCMFSAHTGNVVRVELRALSGVKRSAE